MRTYPRASASPAPCSLNWSRSEKTLHLSATSTRNRGVKQALFHVLLGAEMPSILVEAGFLGNSHDRNMILNPRSRHALASAMARAVENFRDTKNTPHATETLSRCKVH